MAKAKKSIEEIIEDIVKKQLDSVKVKYYTKTESINSEIDEALTKAPSKSGGKGKNYPDIKALITTKDLRQIPVMIEVKGKKGDLIKLNEYGDIDNYNKDKKESNFSAIQKYAVNGAVHYADAVIRYTDSYNEVIAIGITGWDEYTETIIEFGVYYISKDTYLIPKKIGDYSDLSFLETDNIDKLLDRIQDINLTEEEKERKSKLLENEIEIKLKLLNQKMQDIYNIAVGSRVQLLCGMIMAGLGVENRIQPLQITDLKGESGNKNNDGQIILNKIEDFLAERNLPTQKQSMIMANLTPVFIFKGLQKQIDGKSILKQVYITIKNEIMPIFKSARHLDFMGKLFNVLNDWVKVPDGAANDVVLTPRYVTEMMAKIALVNKDSYVWDYALGSGGFLISAMKLMIEDAKNSITSEKELSQKILDIKAKQLLGIEVLPEVYILAILNMILMGDGSANILNEDSLTDFNGNYQQGEMKDKEFPANVFLLNPPYSAKGKGLIFVEKALKRMKNGRAVILIQENAGDGQGDGYSQEILKHSSLLASIHMAKIFSGKSEVTPAIYVFEVGKPHNTKQLVKFINFENYGYTRQNRKRSSQEINLKNTDHAMERYEEVVNLVLYGKKYLHYLTEDDYTEDTITLQGNDWTFSKHRKIDTIPTEADFKHVVKDYLAWKVSNVLKNEDGNFQTAHA